MLGLMNINTSHSLRGLGFFDNGKFTQALKASFVMRYIRKTDENLCKLVDRSFDLTLDTRHRIFKFNPIKN